MVPVEFEMGWLEALLGLVLFEELRLLGAVEPVLEWVGVGEDVLRALEDCVVVEVPPSFVGVSVYVLFVGQGNPGAGILVVINHIFSSTV